MLTPYSGPSANIPDNIRFNETFSAGRVIIEHVMGLLKSRWSSLRGLRTQVRQKSDFVKINRWILATFILHNLVLFCNDQWEEDSEDSDERDGTVQGPITQSGEDLRDKVKKIILERFYT